MEVKKVVIILIAVFLLSIGTTATIYSFYKVYETQRISFDVNVTNQSRIIGFNTDTNALHFGKISRNGAGTRTINITNVYNQEVLIVMKKSSDINEWLSISPNNFILKPYEKRTISFSIKIPDNASSKDYSGIIEIRFLRP